MNKINILILTCSLNLGGAERQVYNLAANIDRRRYNIVIVCLYDIGEMGKALLGKKDIRIFHSIMKHKADVSGVIKLINIMRKERINIMFMVHTPLTLFWGGIAAKISGVEASIVRITSTNPTQKIKRRKIVNSLMLYFIDKIIAQAESHGEYLAHHEGMDPGKIVVINNSIDLQRFNVSIDKSALRQELGLPPDAVLIGIVANLRPEKGHRDLLHAATRILSEFPGVHFLIVGDGGERNSLERTSEELGINAHVHFLGTRKDIPEVVSLFDVAVLASSPHVETFSNAVMEYMAASKPVVVTNAGSIAELVIDGKTGFIVQSGDSAALADAILQLLDDRDLARTMGEAGRKRVEEEYTIVKMIEKYENVFEGLLKSRDAGHA